MRLAVLCAASVAVLVGCGSSDGPMVQPGTTRAVGDGLGDVVVLGTNSVYLEQGSSVVSGDVVANDVYNPTPLADNAELVVGLSVAVPAGSTLQANRIKVKSSAVIDGDLVYNALDNNGTVNGNQTSPLGLPGFAELPDAPPATPGTVDQVVPIDGSLELAPGAYGELKLKKNATVVLTGGEYDFRTINTGAKAKLLCREACEIRVAERFDTDEDSVVGPEPGSGLTAAEIVYYIHGINGSSGLIGGTPKAAQIGLRNEVEGNFWVPNGTLWLRQGSDCVGAFLARDVDVGLGVTVALVSGFGEPAGGLADSAWPKMLHDAANTSRGSGVGATGSPAWTYQTGGATMSPAIGLGGVVYVGSDDSGMRALDPDTGSLIWQFNTQFRCSYGLSIGADGTLYFGSLDHHVYAVDGTTGTQRWATDLGGEISSAPAVGPDGKLYVGARNHLFYALDGQAGSVLWTFPMGHDTASSPAIGPDGAVYFGCYDDRLYALDSQTGNQRWAFTAGGDIQSSPAVADDGRLYFGSWDGNVYCVDSSNGQEMWRYATGGAVNSSAAIGGDGRVYIGSQANKLIALDADTGSPIWQFATSGGVSSSPAIGGDGTVYVGCDDHRLYAVDSTNGQMVWSYQTGNRCEVCPAIGADGTIYIGSWDGKLHAVR